MANIVMSFELDQLVRLIGVQHQGALALSEGQDPAIPALGESALDQEPAAFGRVRCERRRFPVRQGSAGETGR